jgi:PAS domain-containing protein
MLRQRSIPARVRCGFATYFTARPYEDHWVCEYWLSTKTRWVHADAQLDRLHRDHLGIRFDCADLPGGAFLTAGQAWKLARTGLAALDEFGTAQTIVLAGALCLLILSALFAERREYEMILEDSNQRLQLVLAQREEAERTLSDRNTQLALAGKVALVGSYAYDVNADEMQVSEGYAAIHGLPEGTADTTRSAWRTRVHPEDVGRVGRLRSRALRDRSCEHNFEYRILCPNRGVRWIESRSFIPYNSDGSAQRVIGINIDVTDRKQTEARLSDALAAGHVVAFDWDAVTGRSQRSNNADRVIGRERHPFSAACPSG